MAFGPEMCRLIGRRMVSGEPRYRKTYSRLRECWFVFEGDVTVVILAEELRRVVVGGPEYDGSKGDLSILIQTRGRSTVISSGCKFWASAKFKGQVHMNLELSPYRSDRISCEYDQPAQSETRAAIRDEFGTGEQVVCRGMSLVFIEKPVVRYFLAPSQNQILVQPH